MVMDVMAAAAKLEAAGKHVIHMEVGQPSAAAPSTAIEAARAALGEGQLGYTEALGVPSLRGRIARHYSQHYGLDIDPMRVIVTTGSSAGFTLAFLAMFEAGDRIAVAVPGYPPYRHILSALGCEPVVIEVSLQTGWEMEKVKDGYAVNRRILLEGLPRAGLDAFLPADGAFYLYADVSRFSDDSLDFTKRMLEQAGVAATPGLDFDPINGAHYVRFCYAGASADMHVAVSRIAEWLG
jgi:aspartate/methionine/tyrosine aminotransferase